MTNSDTPQLSPEFQRLSEIVLFKQRNLMTHILKKTLEQVSATQFTLLELLSNRKTLNMGQIAKLMCHTTPATTGMIDRLVTAGLVERMQVPNDRRQILIRVTPKGEALVNQAKKELFESMYNFADQLSPEDQQAWFRINDKIYQHFNQQIESA